MYDAIIIGAGPIGLEAAAVFKRAGIRYLHLEQGQIGETITRWPRDTQFFSSPEWVAIAGMPIQTRGQEIVTGEAYLAYLRQVVEVLDLPVNTYETVTSVSGRTGAFTVVTRRMDGTEQTYTTRTIVLATGDMNAPRLLNLSGEDLPHVTHYWRDPHEYFRRRLLIVGGANSAVEAALRCWRAGASVALSYRGEALSEKRLISRLYLEINLLIKNRRIEFYPATEVVEIRPGTTMLRSTGAAVGTELPVAADFVYLATGFTMDQRLYQQLGVATEGTELRPLVDPQTMETNVPGVYVIGTATGGNQRGYKVFITTSHRHCLAVAGAIAPEARIDPAWVGNLSARDYRLSSADVE